MKNGLAPVFLGAGPFFLGNSLVFSFIFTYFAEKFKNY